MNRPTLVADTSATVRTLDIALGTNMPFRIIEGTFLGDGYDHETFSADMVTVTVTTASPQYDKPAEAISVVVSGPGIFTEKPVSKDYSDDLRGAPKFIRDALRDALPDDNTFAYLFVSML